MTDEAERKVREWAKRVNGQPLTNRDIVELVLAVDEDADARHREISDCVAQMQSDHEALARRVAGVEKRIEHAACPADIERIVHEDHEKLHGEHLERDHTQGDEVGNRTFYMWTLGGKLSGLLLGVLGALITIAIAIAFGWR